MLKLSEKIRTIAKSLKFWLWQYWRIPPGIYCHGIKGKRHNVCPYWRQISFLHHQENGYCEYLQWGDIDTNHDESIKLERINVKTGEVIEINTPLEMPFGIGLLWDMCKECGVKTWEPQDFALEIP